MALLIIGAALVVLVFAVSRYSQFFQNLQSKIRQLTDNRNTRQSGKRKTRSDPLLGGTSRTTAKEPHSGEDRLFSFESDENLELETAEAVDSTRPLDHSTHSDSAPESAEQQEDEVESLASLEDETIQQMRKPVGPFTSLRQIDFWIKLSPAAPVTQAEIVSKIGDWDQIQFPVQVHALTQEAPHWVNLLEEESETAIMDVVASYQLLDHGHAASMEDLHYFDRCVSELGSALDAEKLMMATPEQASEQSQKLANFFIHRREPLEVSICAPEGQAFMGKLVETSAKQQGLDFMEGQYVRQKRMASHNVILYRMVSHDAHGFDRDMPSNSHIECVKFTMHPALSSTPGRDAKEMLDAAKAFASRVKGEIRIPGEREYHPDLLLKLRNSVSKLEKDIVAAGLEPGGPEILRIFS